MTAIFEWIASYWYLLVSKFKSAPVTVKQPVTVPEPVTISDPVTVEHVPTVPVTVDVTVNEEDKPGITEFSSQQDD